MTDRQKVPVNRQLGHYEILSLLGAGGMGEVYLARDKKLGRTVALKLLPPDVGLDRMRMQRFLLEAKAAAALSHPNVCVIHEVGETPEGCPFIAMEHIQGNILNVKLQAGPLHPNEILDIGVQVADALEEAHSKGIIHRDIKPSNIMITPRGQVKVLDFGLAKMLQPQGETGAEDPSLAKTRPGIAIGTAHYMSPEQALGKEVDRRTDIFSLGVVLYLMATGRLPFPGTSAAEAVHRIVHSKPESIARLNANIPIDLEYIVRKCLEKDPGRRYQSAQELLLDLKELKRECETGTKSISRALPLRTVRWLYLRFGAAFPATLVLVFVAVLALALWLFYSSSFRPPKTLPVTRIPLAVLYFDNLTQDQALGWLERGITEMLMTNLAQMQNLEVVSSQRLFDILHGLGKKETERIDRLTAGEVARRANVRAVVSGSIVKIGDRIRLNVVLEDVGTGRVLFSDKADGDSVQEIFRMVDDVTLKIASNYGAPTTPGEKARSITEITTNSVEAFKLYQQGIENLANLNHFEAIRNFEAATRIDPQFAFAHMQQAFALWQNGDTEGSKQAIAKAVEHIDRSGSKERLLILGMEAQIKGEWKTAVDIFENITSSYPKEKEPFVWLAWAYDWTGQLDKAIASLRRAIEIDPGFAQAFNELGYRYINKGEYQNAVTSFKKYVELRPTEANSHDSLGDAYTRMGEYENALNAYNAALKLKPSLLEYWEYLKVGIVYHLRGDEAQARESIGKYLTVTKDAFKPSGHSVLASIAMAEGNSRDARRHWDHALQAATRSRADWAIAPTLVLFSQHHLFFKRYQEAGRLAEQARIGFQETRDGPLVLLQAANVLAASGKYSEAQKIVDDYVAEHPEKVTVSLAGDLVSGIKAFIAFSKGDFGEAITIWRQTADQRIKNPANACRLAYSYFETGLWREAEQVYLEAAKRRQINLEHSFSVYYYPEHEFVLSHYYLGRICEETGRKDKAAEYYRKFLSHWEKADFRLAEISDAKLRLGRLDK